MFARLKFLLSRNFRHILYVVLLVLVGIGMLALLDNAYRNELQRENARWLNQSANTLQWELTQTMHRMIESVERLHAFMLAADQLPNQDVFDRFAASLHERYPGLLALVYVDADRVIRRIVPLESNRAAVGLDLKQRPTKRFVEQAIRERRLIVDDPHTIVGGNLAVLARAPLYQRDRFLGLAQGVFDIPYIINTEFTPWEANLQFNLRDREGRRFWGTEDIPGEPYTRVIVVGDNYWTLTLGRDMPVSLSAFYTFILIWVFGGGLVMLLAIQLHHGLNRAKRLKRTVERKTRELAESERKYRTLLEHAGDGIVLADMSGAVIDVNQRFLSLSGYSRQELLRMRLTDFHPEHEREALGGVFKELGRGGFTIKEHELVLKNGETIPVEVAAAQVPLGHEKGALGLFRDIRERKRIEAELESYQQQLEQLVTKRTAELVVANQELEAFSYSVSHDLRAPLRTINGFTEVLEEEYGSGFDEEAKGYMERIRRATVRMEHLIDGLLALSQTARHSLSLTRVNLSRMVSEIIEERRLAEPERQVQVTIQADLVVTADAALLRSLMENLLGNAWKFSRHQERAIIEFGVELNKLPLAVYYVRDNGIGFEAECAKSMFQPFNRLPSSFEGTGIGLATSQRIVSRHNGEIWADGIPCVGAIFYFTLNAEFQPALDAEKVARPAGSAKVLNCDRSGY